MGDTNVKIFTVTGEAATSIGGTRKRKKRTTARTETVKLNQEGGTSPGTLVQIQANRAPDAAPLPPPNFKNSTETNLAKVTTDSAPAPVQGGGNKAVKVILEKKKKGTKVLLAPTKIKKMNPLVQPTHQAKTRKVAKKIRMSLNGFGKRVVRANTIRVDAKKQKLDDVKKILIEAKLIKPDSKAPEAVLRQMYSDYMMLKNRAL